MEPVRCAVIGLGMIGSEHARILHSLPQADLIAVCDRRAELHEAFRDLGAGFFDDVERCLDTPGLEAVWVCTPQSTHLAIARAALDRGIHVLCEKPLAADRADALELAEHGDTTIPRLVVGHTLRFQAEFVALQQAVEAGTLGRIVQIAATRNVPDFEGAILSGRTTPIGEVAVHDLDMMLQLCGPAVEVSAMTSTIAVAGPGPDATSALVRFASGAVGSLVTNWITPSRTGLPFVQRFSVFGTEGTATVDTTTSTVALHSLNGAAYPNASYLAETHGVFGGALAVEDARFLAIVRNGGEWPVTLRDAVRALELAAAVDEAAAAGATVAISTD